MACSKSTPREVSPPPSAVAAAPAHLSTKLALPAAARVVAIGDLHGDLDAARRVLRLAGAIDASDEWIGGTLVVVQTGDEIDRGDGDRAILDLFDRLAAKAKAAGGALVALVGNHELMNAALDFRYVTPGGFAAFADVPPRSDSHGDLPQGELGRAAAFAPRGPYAIDLAARPLFVEVGETIFVHGGVLPSHVRYGLDRMNDEVDDWLRGNRASPPAIVDSQDGPLWTRRYSMTGAAPDCAALDETLAALGERRMVVGHTVQPDINSACDARVWRIDTGMSRAYGGPIEALEIRGDQVTVLRENAPRP
ncbi:MAG TPA: metallophosphoesterase [Polyangiaceae bacterium]